MMNVRLLGVVLVLVLVTVNLNVEAEELGFVETRGLHFVANGSIFFANGYNAYWLMTMASDPSQRPKVSSALSDASSHGLTVARTWAFNDGGGSNALQTSPGAYNEQTFQGLDFVVSEARKFGTRMILSLANNYDNFGGKKQYVEWGRLQGQIIASEDEFFTNPVVKDFYKNHVKAVLTRVNTITGVAYKDDPTIFAWELMNEPRCPSDLSGKNIQEWIAEMAAYLKSIDENHSVEAGLEGFYGKISSNQKQDNPRFQVGTDFIANNQIPQIDFATIHSYPDQWLSTPDEQSQLAFLNNWLDAHIDDARNVLRKPLLVAEFGKSTKDPGFSTDQRDAVFRAVYSKIYASARTGGATAGSLFWQLMAQGMESYGDGYEIVLGESAPTTTRLIAAQSRQLRLLSGAPAGRGGVPEKRKIGGRN
ncbi:mannan endo-1,4-beta-mannosidase 1-like isoform X1 [Zingiber officinale]|uniref:mannan endo-1,4-beta-mannosidase 1-like isoform X1 n=1 Tax=Zingiber officinale TaxID=94328 RepID=UPI001C4D1946|nr:mannan endo-1,4-beta-mannosidase 1-like isoform X1 [Zingiber officinale]